MKKLNERLIEINEELIEAMVLQIVERKLQQVEETKVFWSMEDLVEQTDLSINTIKDKFFYDERFPKYKVGSRWIMPAKECEAFLLQWIKEQPRK